MIPYIAYHKDQPAPSSKAAATPNTRKTPKSVKLRKKVKPARTAKAR
ncbi:MAG: hypothetical protein QM783_06090 [Phycisphaerales bacterium]